MALTSAHSCFVCRASPASVGVECDACARALSHAAGLAPEHVTSPPVDADGAWLVDPWGRAHPARAAGVVGRRGDLVAILSAGVSRQHARLDRAGASWTITDLGSRNGTTVEGAPSHGPVPLRHGVRLGFSDLEVWFAVGEPAMCQPAPSDSPTASPGLAPGGRRLRIRAGREILVELLEPSAAEGGVLVVGGARVRMTLLQLQLVRRLVAQLDEDAAHPAPVRGFVPSINLLVELPWASRRPESPHLKQLVRRTRRLLEGTGLVIEATQGFGYRIWTDR